MFTYFIENNLISENQSGFRPGDSCVNQLLAITLEIFSSFENNYKVQGLFLEISKAFVKVGTRELSTNLNQTEFQEIC